MELLKGGQGRWGASLGWGWLATGLLKRMGHCRRGRRGRGREEGVERGGLAQMEIQSGP